MPSPRPPRLFERLLDLALPPGIVREDVAGSLAEEHAARVRRIGRVRAGWWYRTQVLDIAARAVWAGMRTTTREGTMGSVAKELWQAAVRLARAPAFALAVVATLALGIGGTATVFGLVDGVLVRPLPYPDADRLVWLRNGAPDREFSFSMADYLALEEQQTSFSAVAAYDPNGIALTTGEGSERLEVAEVTAAYMPLLGIEPILGRAITEADTRPGADPVVLLSHDVWTSRFGADPDILGRAVTLNQEAVTVIGVLPPLDGPIEWDRDFFRPLTLEPPPRKGPFGYYVFGRLRDGVDRASAGAEAAAISERIFPIWQDSFRDREVRWVVRDLKEALLGDVASSLWLALAAVGALLLIALTNAANLLVARAAEQERASAVRVALGAGWARMLLHRLAESGVLATVGGAAGLAIAWLGLRAVGTLGGGFIPRVSEIGLDGTTLAFLVLTVGVAALVLGLVPALRGEAPLDVLRGSSRTASATARASRLRQLLVITQLSVTVPLLVGAALLASSLASLRAVDPGFRAEGLLTMGVTLPPVGYEDGSARLEFWNRLGERVRALPGVEAVGVGNGRPPDEPGFGNNFVLEDLPLAPGTSQPSVPWTIADRGYFRALELGVLAGRMFDVTADSAQVALVDETWARRFFDTPADAVGRRFVHGGCTDFVACPLWEVIGVVERVEYNGVRADDEGAMYLDGERFTQRSAFVLVRAPEEQLASLEPTVRRIVRELDPRVPVYDVATGSELMAGSLEADRYLAVLIGLFGSVALLLSLVGVYGVVAYFVEQHRKDIGIRLALGGEPGRVAALVVGTAMRFVVTGVAVGSVLAFALSSSLERVLFAIDPSSPWFYLAVALGLSGAALLACSGPALRASRLDPALTLKEE